MRKSSSTPSGSRKDADVYLHAAELEATERIPNYSACWSIQNVIDPSVHFKIRPWDLDQWPDAVGRFWVCFKPEEPHAVRWWEPSEQESRILALCFMAALVEAGDA